MKTFTLAVLAAALFTSPALAQEAPAPGGAPPTPSAQMRQQFEAMHKQMEQVHTQMRSQILAALTPANRQLLASVAGQLAISASPDYKAAAAKLDAALSSSEKTAIMNAEKSAHDKMKAQMESMRSQMPSGGPSMHGDRMHGQMMIKSREKHEMTAGELLLHMSSMDGMMAVHTSGMMMLQPDHP